MLKITLWEIDKNRVGNRFQNNLDKIKFEIKDDIKNQIEAQLKYRIKEDSWNQILDPVWDQVHNKIYNQIQEQIFKGDIRISLNVNFWSTEFEQFSQAPNPSCSLPLGEISEDVSGSNVRWFYNSLFAECGQFLDFPPYEGKNSFKTQEECERKCPPQTTMQQPTKIHVQSTHVYLIN